MGIALLLYQHFTCNKISRLLVKHNIQTIHIPMKKTSSTLRLIKDSKGLKTSGIYCIPCECGKVYVGQTASTIEIRYQEHIRHLPIGHTEKSTVAEHLLNTGHEIQFKKNKQPHTHTHTHTQSEQDEYVHGLDCERSHRNLTKFQKLQQGDRLHIKLYMAASYLLKCFPQPTTDSPGQAKCNDLLTPPHNQRHCFHPMSMLEIHTTQGRTPSFGSTKPSATP
jgi:hypothetical protein